MKSSSFVQLEFPPRRTPPLTLADGDPTAMSGLVHCVVAEDSLGFDPKLVFSALFSTSAAEWPTFFTASESRSFDTLNLSAQYWTSCGSSRLMRLRSCGPLFVRSSAMCSLRDESSTRTSFCQFHAFCPHSALVFDDHMIWNYRTQLEAIAAARTKNCCWRVEADRSQ